MNGYQRDKMQDLPHDASEYMSCCDKEVEQLDEAYLTAVEKDDLAKIQEYLDSDKDVNAELAGDSILSRACTLGKVEVVKLLLNRPGLHLNKTSEQRTPIALAAEKGHVDCVKAILDARLKCRPLLKKSWHAVLTILNRDDECCSGTLLHILGWAIYECQWDVVKRILKIKVYIPHRMMYQLVLQAVDRSQWELAKEALQKKFSGRPEILLEVLSLHAYLRQWKRVDEILQLLNENLAVDEQLVDAALEDDVDAVRKLLDEKLKANVISGSFLAVAATGTKEMVADLFVGVKDVYSHEIYSDALFLAAMGQHSEYLCPLLSLAEANFSYHDMARAHRILELVCLDEAPNQSIINYFDHVMEMEAKAKCKDHKP